MGISESLQWWEEWQLRVLVLTSLILQFSLAIAAPMRKRSTHLLLRIFTWLAYLGSDAIAIYALATLFNRYKKQEWVSSTNTSRSNLQVVWAPIILMHLGGQDGITAYNVEDNELWRRHLLTAVSQVTVAIYVFYKSWSGERRLLQTAILVFIPGILKCFEKPWALKNASITSLTNSTGWDGEDDTGSSMSLKEYVAVATNSHTISTGWDTPGYVGDNDDLTFTETVQVGFELMKPTQEFKEISRLAQGLFVDIVYPYHVRLKNLKCMVENPAGAHDRVKYGLSTSFDRLYTKHEVSKGAITECTSLTAWCGNIVRVAVPYLSFAAIGVFHKSHKEGYDGTDIKVTYTLLCCTASLEYLIPFGLITISSIRDAIRVAPWPDRVAQYNLIGYLARCRKHTWRGKLAALVGCKDSLDQLWRMKPFKSSNKITELVHGHVMDGWKNYIKDPVTYSSFNDIRGQWTLEKECGLKKPFDESVLVWQLTRPFDESVLIWHLATDLCFYSTGSTGEATAGRYCSREISNYMVYLLFFNPEMLMTGTRRNLFTTAYGELSQMLNDDDDKLSRDGRELAQVIMQRVEKGAQGSTTSLIRDAWALAQELMGLGKEEEGPEKMWKVIQGVWVEMLCFSASRCRGYLHAKNLSKGGEYLSYVWLLQSCMGMETLAERLQRTELPEYGDKGATVPTPAARVTTARPRDDDNATASTPASTMADIV